MGVFYQHLQYIRSESNTALIVDGWMREGLVEMRKLSLNHSDFGFVAMVNTLLSYYESDW